MTQLQAKLAVGDYFRTKDGNIQWLVLDIRHETVDQVPFVRYQLQVGVTKLDSLQSEVHFLKDVEKAGGIACWLEHRYDENGNHQLVMASKYSQEVCEYGKMVNQYSIAMLGKWAAVTEYHGWGEGKMFPTEVFEIRPSKVNFTSGPV